jgi:hypothetical protein
MIDRSLMIVTLTILREQADLTCGTEENSLMNEVNLRASRPITTQLVTEHLSFAADKGWCDWKMDSLRMRRWRITPSGRGALDDLKQNG